MVDQDKTQILLEDIRGQFDILTEYIDGKVQKLTERIDDVEERLSSRIDRLDLRMARVEGELKKLVPMVVAHDQAIRQLRA